MEILNCRRDYENLFDYNAIKVYLDDLEIGYLPRNIAQIIAPEMDSGLLIISIEKKIDFSNSIPKVFVKIKIKE